MPSLARVAAAHWRRRNSKAPRAACRAQDRPGSGVHQTAGALGIMKRLVRHPLFVAGLAVRLLLLATVLPSAVQHWYAPFLSYSVEAFGLDPWSSHLAAGGDPRSEARRV